ncbi:MAG: hypothetical protein JWN20_433 [Jatrophihabitantaceae bacterium]|nr:hypothetical protein [Jatrophihabitantaceae bacterium]
MDPVLGGDVDLDGQDQPTKRVCKTGRSGGRRFGVWPLWPDSWRYKLPFGHWLWIPLATGLVSLASCGYVLLQPHMLKGVHGFGNGHGYDDGVYLGAAIRLIHGSMPYRDFVYVHPPGALLLFSPFAAIGEVLGHENGLMMARCMTALVVGANAALAALAVRHHGASAMLVAGLALACFPLAFAAGHTLTLEPYLVLFCLLGTVWMISDGKLATSPRRLWVAGMFFGLAGDVKAWAIFPAIAAIYFCLRKWRSSGRPFCIGLIAGFVLPTLPFFLAAPARFIQYVFIAQLNRSASESAPVSVQTRLVKMSGARAVFGDGVNPTVVVFVLSAAAVFVALIYLATARRTAIADWYILLGTLSVVGGMFLPGEFYDHYAYFPAAFASLVAGVTSGKAEEILSARQQRLRVTRHSIVPLPARLAVPGVALLLAAASVFPVARSATTYLNEAGEASALIRATIPAGSCTLTDDPVLLIASDRITSKRRGCPSVIDPFGMWLTEDHGATPHFSESVPIVFASTWQAWMQHADYVVLSVQGSDYIPWTAATTAWFADHYEPVASGPHAFVYKRVPLSSAALIQRGVSEQQAGQNDSARSDFTAALVLNPKASLAYFNLGVMSQDQGDADTARAMYLQALSIDENFRAALFNLAVLNTKSAPTDALALYKKIIANDSKDAYAALNLGFLLLEMGDRVQALLYLDTAVRLDPSLASRVPTDLLHG